MFDTEYCVFIGLFSPWSYNLPIMFHSLHTSARSCDHSTLPYDRRFLPTLYTSGENAYSFD